MINFIHVNTSVLSSETESLLIHKLKVELVGSSRHAGTDKLQQKAKHSFNVR